MLKKLCATLLVIVILFSFSVVVFASDDLEILPDGSYDVGDVDMDGEISIMDATTLQEYLANLKVLSEEQLVLADANFDGVSSIMDVTAIQMHLAGISNIVRPTPPTPTQSPIEDDDKPIELPFVPAQ